MDSVNSGRYVLSDILGISSIALWFVALLPQAYVNWRHKSADGLSILFLLLWLIGDSMNLVGCIVLQQRLFQKVLSAYYILLDVLLLAQFVIYRRTGSASTEPTAVSPVHASPIDECNRPLLPKHTQRLDITSVNYQSVSIHSTARTSKKRGWSIRVMACLCIAAMIAFGLVRSFKKPITDKLVAYDKVGLYLAWGSSVIYHLSRLPQLWHSYKRQSVEGLSKAMFLVIIGANGLYFASLSCLVPVIDRVTLLQTIPFIYGALMSFVLDLFVLAQFRIYSRKSRISGSAQHPA